MKKVFLLVSYLYLSYFLSIQVVIASTEKEVVVNGIGRTENEAQMQAFRNAIRNVVGSMVLSEVLIENEEILRDKVFSHSNGYITKSKQVGNTRMLEGGLFEVTMQVTVKKEKLTQKLKDEKISLTSIDGQSLFAQKKTKDESTQNINAIIFEKFKKLPVGVLKAEADIENAKQRTLNGTNLTRLSIPIILFVDKVAYASFFKDLTKTLDSLALKSKIKAFKGDKYDARYSNNIKTLAICESFSRRSNNMSRWKLYGISDEIYNNLINFAETRRVQVIVQLINKNGHVVSENMIDTQPSNENMDRWIDKRTSKRFASVNNQIIDYSPPNYYGGGIVFITPKVSVLKGFGTGINAVFLERSAGKIFTTMSFDITEDELKSITSIKCMINNIN